MTMEAVTSGERCKPVHVTMTMTMAAADVVVEMMFFAIRYSTLVFTTHTHYWSFLRRRNDATSLRAMLVSAWLVPVSAG